jgi:hypothetical protein
VATPTAGDSGATSIDTRNIIIAPPRDCPIGQRKDTRGVCKRKW